MIFKAVFSADGQEDINLPIISFSGRQKSGARSTFQVVCGWAYAAEIDARVPGRVAVHAISGGYEYEVWDYPIVGVNPSEGANSRAITVDCEGQATWIPAVDPWPLGSATYRAPNRTDGKWSYRLAGPILNMRPGDSAVYGDHTFTVGTIIWQVSASSMSVELAEA